jgi:flagellar biosynthesis chaperone FliJ
VFSFVLQQKDDEINQLKKETTRLNKVRETIQRRLRQIEDLKAEVEQQKETLKSQNLALERGKYLFLSHVI